MRKPSKFIKNVYHLSKPKLIKYFSWVEAFYAKKTYRHQRKLSHFQKVIKQSKIKINWDFLNWKNSHLQSNLDLNSPKFINFLSIWNLSYVQKFETRVQLWTNKIKKIQKALKTHELAWIIKKVTSKTRQNVTKWPHYSKIHWKSVKYDCWALYSFF